LDQEHHQKSDDSGAVLKMSCHVSEK
jgi:hypothetical protein